MNVLDKLFSEMNTIDPDPLPWMKEKNFVLIKDLDVLKEVVEKAIESKLCALDLETQGLDNRIKMGRTVHQIVGYCLSYDGETGYYVPVRHMVENPVTGLPEKHPDNLAPLLVAQVIKELCENCRMIYHNSAFDLEFLYGSEAHFEDPPVSMFEDTMILDYLKDSTSKNHGLKALSKEYLDMEMIELSDLFPVSSKDKDFSKLDPNLKSTLYYAGSDAICTYLLFDYLKDYGYVEQPQVYRVEKSCVHALRWTERNRMTVDTFYTHNLLEEVKALTENCQNTIYQELSAALRLDEDVVRQRYDINSPKQLGAALVDLQKMSPAFSKIELPRTENSGQVQTNNAAMDSLTEKYGDEFPFFALVKTMRSLQKVEGTYIRPIHENADSQDSTIRFSFQAHRVDTGRFSASKGKPEHGYSGINVQSVPAPVFSASFKVRRITKRPEGMGDAFAEVSPGLQKALDKGYLKHVYDGHFIKDNRTGHDLCVRTTCEGCPFEKECQRSEIESFKDYSVEQAVRPSLVAPEGFILCGIDYSGLELRAVANMCEEPRWIDEFYRCGTCQHEFEKPTKLGGGKWKINEVPPALCPKCGSDKIGDLHTLTTQIIWGDDVVNLPGPEFKDKRGKSKGVNFSIIYGGGGGAIARATGVESKEGWQIRKKMLNGLPLFNKWMENTIHLARQNQEVETAIGRKIRLWNINSEDGFIRSKQERNAVNSIVQGSATGDLIKYAMAKVYKAVKKNNWLEDCRMVLTIHDELVFEIRQSMLDVILPVIDECMTEFAILKKWAIPLVTDVEFNTCWSPKYNWTHMQSINQTTGIAAEGVPDFLTNKISFHKGMWKKVFGEIHIWDGTKFVTEEDFETVKDVEPPEPVAEQLITQTHQEENEEVSMDLVQQFNEQNAKKEAVQQVRFPYYDFKTYAPLTTDEARTSYNLRLKRVLQSLEYQAKLGKTHPTHTLRITTTNKMSLLPPQKIVEVDPQHFELLAFYEGL